jgi:hypothetical protein
MRTAPRPGRPGMASMIAVSIARFARRLAMRRR